jgi:hypothetical protein
MLIFLNRLKILLWLANLKKRKQMFDPCSFSNPGEIKINHYDINLLINFKENRFVGYVDLDLEYKSDCTTLILDTRYLEISKLLIFEENEFKESDKYELSESHKIYGKKLSIETKKSKKIRIFYNTQKEGIYNNITKRRRNSMAKT